MAKPARRPNPPPSEFAPQPASEGPMLVRIKPLDPRRGHRLKTFVHGPTGKRFDERKGWYRVSAEIAEALRDVRVDECDDRSNFAFDVVSAEDAKRIDAAERKEAIKRADAETPNDLGTRDLHRRPADRPQDSPDDRRNTQRSERPERGARSMRTANEAASSDPDPFET